MKTRRKGWRSGSTRTWRNLRARFLAENPTCACGAKATMIDHIVALADGGSMYDWSNWQPVCGRCHADKTARENTARRGQTYRPRARIDPETGLPLSNHWWAE